MVMDDLSAQNFKLGDRIIGLDEDQIKVLLKKIAQFHAASMVVVKEKPELLTGTMNLSVFEKQPESIELYDEIMRGNLPHIAEKFKDKIGYEKIAEKLKAMYGTFKKTIIQVCHNTKKDNVKVINHGDLWVNNFLFKHDAEGKAVDVSMVMLVFMVF